VKAGPKAAPDPRPLALRGSTRRELAVARFALDHIRVPRGHGVRKPFRLRPWQRELVALTWDRRPRPRLAGLCFRAAVRMVELNPELERRVQLFQDRMVVPKRGASFQVLPAVPKRLEGLDYTLAILDEAGRIDRDVFEVVTLATGKQRASVGLAIGTPGPELDQTVLGGCAPTPPSIPTTR
jgi:hypothetical protein